MSRDDAATLLTVAQAATILGVHPNTIRTWTDAGRLTAYRINSRGDRRFRRGDVERLLVEDRPADDGLLPSADAPQERSGELAVFGRIAAGLASSPTTASVARAVVEALRTELDVDRAAIYVGDRRALRARWRTPGSTTLHRSRAPLGADASGRRRSCSPRSADRSACSSSTRSRPRRQSSEFRRSLASMVATTLASTRLLSRARRELQRARALRSVTKELTGTLDLAAVLGEVVDLTRSLFEADKAGLWLVTPADAHPFSVAAHHGLSDAFLERVEGAPDGRRHDRHPGAARTTTLCHEPRRQGRGRPAACRLRGGGDPDRLPRAAGRRRPAARPARPLPPLRAQLARGGGGAGPGVRRPGRGRHPERAPVSVRRRRRRRACARSRTCPRASIA